MRRQGLSLTEELFVRGSLMTLKRKCGKPTCHCAPGEPHSTPALSYCVGGSTKMLTLRAEDVPKVKAALARYRKAHAELSRKALRGLNTLRAYIVQQKAEGRARPR